MRRATEFLDYLTTSTLGLCSEVDPNLPCRQISLRSASRARIGGKRRAHFVRALRARMMPNPVVSPSEREAQRKEKSFLRTQRVHVVHSALAADASSARRAKRDPPKEDS